MADPVTEPWHGNTATAEEPQCRRCHLLPPRAAPGSPLPQNQGGVPQAPPLTSKATPGLRIVAISTQCSRMAFHALHGGEAVHSDPARILGTRRSQQRGCMERAPPLLATPTELPRSREKAAFGALLMPPHAPACGTRHARTTALWCASPGVWFSRRDCPRAS